MGGKLTWKSQTVSLLGILAHQGCCHLWNNKPITVGQLVRKKKTKNNTLWCALSHTQNTPPPCKQDTHAFFVHRHPQTYNPIALCRSCTSVSYLFSTAAFISIFHCVWAPFLCSFLSVCVVVYVCVCLRVFWQPDTSLFREQISRYCERTSGFFLCVCVGEEGELVGVGPVFGRAKNVWMCVFLSNSGRGNQTGPVWSFVFIDKCTGRGNRKATEKFVFLRRNVLGSVYVCVRAQGNGTNGRIAKLKWLVFQPLFHSKQNYSQYYLLQFSRDISTPKEPSFKK